MKKYSMILVSLLLVMVLTGCGNKNTVENPINPEAPKVIEGETGNKNADKLLQDIMIAAENSNKSQVNKIAQQLIKYKVFTKEVVRKDNCVYVFYTYSGKNYETNNCSK